MLFLRRLECNNRVSSAFISDNSTSEAQVVEGRRGEQKNRVIERLVGELPSQMYQKRPYFPDLLHQPDLLIIPEVGRLIVVFLYQVRRSLGWRSALAWLEDLIEVKLNVGEHSIVSALAFSEKGDFADATREGIGLMLRNTFDGFYFPNVWEPNLRAGDLRERLAGLERNVALSHFLAREREQISFELRRFDQTTYKPLIDKSRSPELPHREAEDRIARLISEANDMPVERLWFVPSIKADIARLPRSYRFKFLIGITGRENLGIDVIQSKRYGSRERLRYLMMKARLLRYGIDGGRLWPRSPDFHPTLVVDGNISGPDHDPYRYVRALLSVGWYLLTVDQVPKLRVLLERGNL